MKGAQSMIQDKFTDINYTIGYKKLYVSSIFENLDQNNEKHIGFKKIVNQINDYDEQKIMQTLNEINPNINYDRISESEFLELYLRLNLIPENFEKNQTSIAFIDNKTIVYNHSNQIRFCKAFETDDEIDVIRYLSEKGYGLDAAKNSKRILVKRNQFSPRRVSPDLWLWINQIKDEYIQNSTQSKASLQASPEFSIIDIIKKSQNYPRYPFYHHKLYESKERTQCLKIFKWASLPLNHAQSDIALVLFYQNLQNLQTEGQHFRAAALATFHFDFGRALELLTLAQVDDNAQAVKLMKNIFQALKTIQTNIQNDSFLKSKLENSNLPMKDYSEYDVTTEDIQKAKNCNFLASYPSEISTNFKNIQSQDLRFQLIQNELNFISNFLKDSTFTHPYLNAIAKFLCNENPSEAVKEIFKIEGLEIFDRIAFALRFFDDDHLNESLQKLIEQAEEEGILECLILVGKDQHAINIVQAYIDNTRDIQTAGLLSAHLMMHRYQPHDLLYKWFKNYKNLLNNMGMFEKRNLLDKEFKSLCTLFKLELEQVKDPCFKSKISIGCNNCNSCLDYKSQLDNIQRHRNQRGLAKISQVLKPTIGVCPSCSHFLPVCSLCLLSCDLINPYISVNKNKQSNPSLDNFNLEEGIVWCQSCNHGGHYKHIVEWFTEFEFCPVSDCSCRCSMI